MTTPPDVVAKWWQAYKRGELRCRAIVNRAAPLAQPDWPRVDERGRRPAMTQVLPASVRRGGERERRFLRAQTLPQVASLWSGACER